MQDTCTVVAKPHPFQVERVTAEFQQGKTITEMLGDAVAHSCEVTINGVRVTREWWDKVRPKAGQILHIAVFPQGGGSGNKWLRAVLMVAVMVVAWYAAPYLTGPTYGVFAGASTQLVAAGIYLVGSLHGEALVPGAP